MGSGATSSGAVTSGGHFGGGASSSAVVADGRKVSGDGDGLSGSASAEDSIVGWAGNGRRRSDIGEAIVFGVGGGGAGWGGATGSGAAPSADGDCYGFGCGVSWGGAVDGVLTGSGGVAGDSDAVAVVCSDSHAVGNAGVTTGEVGTDYGYGRTSGGTTRTSALSRAGGGGDGGDGGSGEGGDVGGGGIGNSAGISAGSGIEIDPSAIVDSGSVATAATSSGTADGGEGGGIGPFAGGARARRSIGRVEASGCGYGIAPRVATEGEWGGGGASSGRQSGGTTGKTSSNHGHMVASRDIGGRV